MQTVNLSHFDYDKICKQLTGATPFNSFPAEFQIVSEKTGKVVTVKTIGYDHPRFDEDHWDGEMQLYEPVEKLDTVELVVLHHGY